MAGPRWRFEDFLSLDEYEFEINPLQGGTPAYSKSIIAQSTAAAGGKVLLFEGRDEPGVMTISGTLRSEDQLNKFQFWYDKRNQVKIFDDLGREFHVYISKFSATRVKAFQAPWKHEWEMELIILDWP
jgi:hypothetical protein